MAKAWSLRTHAEAYLPACLSAPCPSRNEAPLISHLLGLVRGAELDALGDVILELGHHGVQARLLVRRQLAHAVHQGLTLVYSSAQHEPFLVTEATTFVCFLAQHESRFVTEATAFVHFSAQPGPF